MSGHHALGTFVLCAVFAACRAPAPMEPAPMESLLAVVPADSAQALVVQPAGGAAHAAIVAAFARDGAGWRRVFGPLPATVGRAGIVAGADKREGDGGTPAGVHRIGTAFGYATALPTGLGYRQATTDDWWVDAPESPAYNTWVTGKPLVSAEPMRRDDDQYSLGAVVEWNTARREPGRGSAIFLHVWSGPDRPTAGCIAMAASELRRLLGWLAATSRPVVVVAAP